MVVRCFFRLFTFSIQILLPENLLPRICKTVSGNQLTMKGLCCQTNKHIGPNLHLHQYKKITRTKNKSEFDKYFTVIFKRTNDRRENL